MSKDGSPLDQRLIEAAWHLSQSNHPASAAAVREAHDELAARTEYAEQCLGLLRRIVAGWHQSGAAEVWAADALQEAADLVEQERKRRAALAKNLNPGGQTGQPQGDSEGQPPQPVGVGTDVVLTEQRQGENMKLSIAAALLVSACACTHPPATQYPTRPTFLVIDFTDGGFFLTHDDADALDLAKSDENLVFDLWRKQRIYPDGTRTPMRVAK